MKQTFAEWAFERINKGYSLYSIKGPPPYPMFDSDGFPVKKINLKWVCKETQEEFLMEYPKSLDEPEIKA